MDAIRSLYVTVAVLVVLCSLLSGCGGDNEQAGSGQPASTQQAATTTPGSATAPNDAAAPNDATTVSTKAPTQAETEVAGMPAEFPADVPVHAGTVTDYEHTKVTDSTSVHQLTVQTKASFAEVVQWYQTQLPADWSVGFIEEDDGVAKIALNGGDYAPASADGRGGGVIIGVFEGERTEIVTTVTVMTN